MRMPEKKFKPPYEKRKFHVEEKVLDKDNVKTESAKTDNAKANEASGSARQTDAAILDLTKKLEEAERQLSEFRDEAARAKADFYNYRTRVERDRARDRTLAAEGTVDALLPVLDNLDRTLQAVTDKDSPLFKGVAMVQRQFFATLQGLGLQVISTDCPFDPALHEAMMVVEVGEEQDGAIIEELHRGYILGEKVLRAAQVKVGRKPACEQ